MIVLKYSLLFITLLIHLIGVCSFILQIMYNKEHIIKFNYFIGYTAVNTLLVPLLFLPSVYNYSFTLFLLVISINNVLVYLINKKICERSNNFCKTFLHTLPLFKKD